MRVVQQHIISKAGRTSVLALSIFALTTNVSHAIDRKLTFSQDNTTIGNVINTVQEQSKYIFAFDSRTFDPNRTIVLHKTTYSIEEIIKLMVSDMGYAYMIKDNYIVINSSVKKKARPEQKPVIEPIVNTKYIYQDITIEAAPKVPDNSVRKEENEIMTKSEHLQEEVPTPYSSYRSPYSFSTMQTKLPHVALKTNLLYGTVAMAPNIAIEVGLRTNMTLELSGSYNWRKHKKNNIKQTTHYIIRPELRWWMCERYNGHFIGAHFIYAQYQISGKKVPTLFKKENRYKGLALGAGVTYGYQLPLNKKWGVEFNVGVGAAYLDYDQYTCSLCDTNGIKDSKFYFGPTRAGVSLVFLIR